MMKHIIRRFLVALYVLWGILYLLIVLNARQLAATMMADPAFVSQMISALAGAGTILGLATVVAFVISRIVEQGSENKIDTVEIPKTVSTEMEAIS